MKIYKFNILQNFNKVIFILSSLLFCFCDSSFLNYNINELFIPNKILKFNDAKLNYDSKGALYYDNYLFSGYLIKIENEKLLEKKGYFNGYLEGKSLGYYKNGNLKYKRLYKDGKKTGRHIGWFKSGQKKFEYFFKKGLSEGNHKQWYDNGMMFSEINYLKGKPFGLTRVWRKDGKLRSNFVIRENGRRYGLAGIKRCTKIDTKKQILEPYLESN